jgi:hypothetical protein
MTERVGGRSLLDHLRDELGAMVQALADGRDVAPARRLHLEGAMEAALGAGLLSEETVAALCAALLSPPHAVQIERGEVQLLLWQERAPVWPTAGD